VSTLDTPPDVAENVEALFREARQRRRRRWMVGIGSLILAVAVVAAIIVISTSAGHSPSPVHRHTGLPQWRPSAAARSPEPSQFVTGDNQGGIGVYSTATGKILRQLSAQTSGGPDQQPSLSVRGSVYFVQPQGSCASSIQAVSVTGSQGSTTAVSAPGIMALDPAPSPTSSLLAWVGSACGSGGVQSTLYITNQATGQRSDLGPFTGRANDEGIAWSPDGTLLAEEAAPTVKLLDIHESSDSAKPLTVQSGCILSDPSFVSVHELAVVRSCFATSSDSGSSEVLIYNTETGKATFLAGKLPAGQEFQSLSADADGHLLVGVSQASGSAHTALLRAGRFVPISDASPTGAQWVGPGRN
jgi:Tol biopolymer transport system component